MKWNLLKNLQSVIGFTRDGEKNPEINIERKNGREINPEFFGKEDMLMQ